MARYCFYCGNELKPGEKCTCRTSANNSSHTASGKSASPFTYTQNQSTKTASAKPNQQAKSDTHSTSDKSNSKAKKTAKKKNGKTEKSSGQRVVSPNEENRGHFRLSTLLSQIRAAFPSFSKALRPAWNMIAHPSTTISTVSSRHSIKRIIGASLFFSAISALLALKLTESNSPFFTMVMSLLFGELLTYMYAHPFITLGLFFSIVIICVLVLAGCFAVVSRLFNRKLSFLRALDVVSISSFYMSFMETLLMISLLLGSQGAFTIVFISLILMGVAQFIAFRTQLTMCENKTFLFLFISYALFYILSQAIISFFMMMFIR
ncbi:MAG TPA: hypothetical protein PKV44_04590 [Bacillota bacterium]|nr:hypothetical protein [Bacillota bacterium]HPE38233.1 hypothetical protein [Bacillota bacterium]